MQAIYIPLILYKSKHCYNCFIFVFV